MALYVEIHCTICGRIVMSEAIRPRTLERWGAVAAFWKDQAMAHEHPPADAGEGGDDRRVGGRWSGNGGTE